MESSRDNHIRSWAMLLGGLCFVGAWFFGALASRVVDAWSLPVIVCLLLTSACWAVAGWFRARQDEMSLEGKMFSGAIFAVFPWLLHAALMIAPFALGVRLSPT